MASEKKITVTRQKYASVHELVRQALELVGKGYAPAVDEHDFDLEKKVFRAFNISGKDGYYLEWRD